MAVPTRFWELAATPGSKLLLLYIAPLGKPSASIKIGEVAALTGIAEHAIWFGLGELLALGVIQNVLLSEGFVTFAFVDEWKLG